MRSDDAGRVEGSSEGRVVGGMAGPASSSPHGHCPRKMRLANDRAARAAAPRNERLLDISWEGKDMMLGSHAGVLRQLLHRVCKPRCGRRVAAVELADDNRARPAAHA